MPGARWGGRNHTAANCREDGADNRGDLMFTQPIAFVIGAGASAEYGMPTGAALVRKIASIVKFNSTRRDNPELITLFLDRIKVFELAGQELSNFIQSGVPSIDDALTWFSSRPEIIELGKAAIASEILKAEAASPLYTKHPDPTFVANLGGTWMPHFLSMVMTGHRDEDAETAFNNVSIINFNYDRTIEHFLYAALEVTFGLSESRAKRIVDGLNMFRPYGKVGPLPWQDKSGLAFGEGAAGVGLRAASKNILTFSEGVTDIVRQQIQLALERSRTTIFLRFGFHTQNMNLLRVRSAQAWRRAYATLHGIALENYPDMKHAIAQVVGCQSEDRPVLSSWRAHELLRDLRPALMAVSTVTVRQSGAADHAGATALRRLGHLANARHLRCLTSPSKSAPYRTIS
jgi:hypothetical protein